jgi:hypothetical protein
VSCTSKIAYQSERKARAAVVCIRRHSSALLTPYVCHCGHWHIAPASKGVMNQRDAGFENLFRLLVCKSA